MTRHEETRVLPYSPQALFDMVADVAKYPEFLPWCQGARIRQQDNGRPTEIIEADLIIAFMAFRERFGSKVSLDHEALKIHVDYLDGPFKNLENNWKFIPHADGSEIAFFVEFEFKSRILEGVIGKVFDQAMRKIVSAFEARAKELYG